MDAADKMAVAYKVPSDTKGAAKVMRDGVTEHWMIEDPYLLDAVSALHYTPSKLAQGMAPFKRLLTMGVTINPTFKIRNLIRDSLSAMAQRLRRGIKYAASVQPARWHALRSRAYARQTSQQSAERRSAE